MPIQAVIFDLGGTIVHYAGEHDRWPDLERPGLAAAYDFLAERSVSLPSLDEFVAVGFDRLPQRWREATAGNQNLTVEDFLIDILQNTRRPRPEKSVMEEAARRYEATVCAGARPVAYGREILALLQSQDYRLGLISNTMFSGASHLQDLERFGLAEYFETMLFSADENKWKPNEAAFYHVADALEVNPMQAVFVGDDPAADMVGARRAGMITVHYPSSSRFQAADSLLADATIHNLRELPGILEQLQ